MQIFIQTTSFWPPSNVTGVGDVFFGRFIIFFGKRRFNTKSWVQPFFCAEVASPGKQPATAKVSKALRTTTHEDEKDGEEARDGLAEQQGTADEQSSPTSDASSSTSSSSASSSSSSSAAAAVA